MINVFRLSFFWGMCCLFFGSYECFSAGFQGHSNSVECIACSPDSKYVVSGSRDGTIRIWEIEIGSSKGTLEGHEDINAIAWSADGKRLLSSGIYDKVILWDFAAQKEIWRFSGKILSVQWSPDEKFILLTQKEERGCSLKIYQTEFLEEKPKEALVQNILFEDESASAS
ncbi:MAG: hypothetical protein Q4C70_10890 [Planctomycetia bacterium]|nr:hypothetical protein [Planctomycetia bacterium]